MIPDPDMLPRGDDFDAWRKSDEAMDAMERGDHATGIRLMREANASRTRILYAKHMLLNSSDD